LAISSAAPRLAGPRRESQRNVAEWHIIVDPGTDPERYGALIPRDDDTGEASHVV